MATDQLVKMTNTDPETTRKNPETQPASMPKADLAAIDVVQVKIAVRRVLEKAKGVVRPNRGKFHAIAVEEVSGRRQDAGDGKPPGIVDEPTARALVILRPKAAAPVHHTARRIKRQVKGHGLGAPCGQSASDHGAIIGVVPGGANGGRIVGQAPEHISPVLVSQALWMWIPLSM